jgi:hypothetical protein
MKKILAVSSFLALFAVLPLDAFAETTSATFPASTAGMSAYVKLGNFSVDNYEAVAPYFTNFKEYIGTPESASSTYIIGVKQYNTVSDAFGKKEVTFHLYLAADGWLVIYLTRGQEPSQIVNWRTGSQLSDTMLKIAIDEAAAAIGAPVAESMKYYDFQHPEANKMTMMRETAVGSSSFSVIVPGQIKQASWAYGCFDDQTSCQWQNLGGIYFDNGIPILVATSASPSFSYGDYDLAQFTANEPHTVLLTQGSVYTHPSAATLILYKTN